VQLEEDNFILSIAKQFPIKSTASLYGIGDDCAVIPYNDNESYVITTDALVEGIHFLKEQIPPFALGYKAIAVNVSDVAAMGGRPLYAFLSIAIPAQIDTAWLQIVMDGITQTCKQWNIELLGGDTVGSKRDIFINITLIGKALQSGLRFRHTAKKDDFICVTGNLGDSHGGLQILQNALPSCSEQDALIKAHFQPNPHLEEGLCLSKQAGVHAMMDISDGLDCDLRRMLSASGCGAIIETTQLPISENLLKICKMQQWDPVHMALEGGEEYCLLLSVAENDMEEVQKAYERACKKKLHIIGKITDTSALQYQTNKKNVSISLQKFRHF
jgi:thiamine-monophosphate kinase